MRYFVSLVQNEWMKANSKRQVPYFYAFIAVITLMVAVAMRFFIFKSDPYPYMAFASDINFLFSSLIGIFIMVVSAQIVTDEYRDGTIKQLLIRPASRTMVLASKMVTVVLILLSVYVFTVICSIVFGMIFFSFMSADVTLVVILKDILFRIPDVLFYAVLAMTAAVLTRSLGLAITVPIVIKSVVGAGMYFFAGKPWYKFLIFPNLNWQPYFNGGDNLPFKEASFGFSVTIYAVYMIVLLGASLIIFNKRDVQ
ncbi:ABC transporter permease [Paenibacillus alvei]|uniref:ABC transporter permease n=2 Tax=Paenibacillus TaxID=44249 RepID=A0ABT4H4W9_PAEAL|nr:MULTISPECIES: ABC transporter permease [Paenibacillus]EJW17710.1 hypothetical protein PAV_3c01550 [Paenibacillus alvei DSM 29]MCY7486748.1 ABC transporter permease [Paenibacillus alvei]MCY9540678.1 ABC transporter permease [Paenibacillus alvei]MCY9707079.1 ABC transporter permease [Paenibacillus alvei]MCY9735183.1 ABC transporter permease [Paenibacillus alvei]